MVQTAPQETKRDFMPKKALKSKYSGYALILGAGASVSASGSEVRPPLDGNFLAVAKERLGRAGAPKEAREVWRKFTRKLRLAGLSEKEIVRMRLEQLSTYLEARANLPSLQLKQGRPAQYREALTALKSVICRLLVESNGNKSCSLHRRLINYVNPKCIVTFNYDMIVDLTVMEMGRLAYWDRSYAGGTITSVSASGKTNPVQRPKWQRRGTIPVFKLHGSMNWNEHKKRDGFSLYLNQFKINKNRKNSPDILKLRALPPRPMIVPPVAAKMNVKSEFLKVVWSESAKKLKEAKGWIFWGYSFPQTDTLTQVLFRTALRNNRKPKPVIVINPDSGVFSRIKTSVSKIRDRHYAMSIERFLIDHGIIKL